MKSVFYLSQSQFPSQAANSVHVMKMAQAFSRVGLDVTLGGIRTRGSGKPDIDALFRSYAVQRLFRLYLFGHHYKPMRSSRYILSSLWRAYRARSGLIYTRFPRAAVTAERLGWRAVVELHHPVSSKWMHDYVGVAQRPVIVVITEALRKKVIAELNCDPDIVIVAPDGADLFPEGVQPAIPPTAPDRLRVGFLGHLYRGKGMEVISALVALCPWADFEIVGGTEPDIAYWRSQTGSPANLRFHGHVPHSATSAYLASLDVALLPNQNFVGTSKGGDDLNISQWTSPLKLFEYMSAGLPVVASDQPNLREVLVHEENALLCAPEDHSAWVAALERMRDSECLRRRLSQNAANDFCSSYSWDARARRLNDLISERLSTPLSVV